MRLENWSVGTNAGPYTPPELIKPVLQGLIYGDIRGRWQDGDPITVSTPTRYEDGKIYTRSGSVYELGAIAPDYEKAYPGARERFLSSFDENGNLKIK